jgi:long-chain acyl-CoA synthetase
MEAKSLGDMLRRSVARYGTRTAVLTPPEKGRDDFNPITYSQFGETVRGYAGAVRALGLTRGDRLVILSDNCVEWALTDWACQTLGVVVVPIYPTLPPEQTEYIVRDSGAHTIVTGSPELAAKVECIEEVQKIALKGSDASLDAQARKGGQSMSEEEWNREIDATGREDLSTIIYTSGTTGQPKGAMLPHRVGIHVCEVASRQLPLNQDDTFLSFLPMSHVYERIAGQYLPISLGATLGYSKSLASLATDMQKVRPTIMMCVPRFLDSFRDRALDAISKQPEKKQKLFNLALAQGVKRAQGGFAPLAWLTDRIVMAKLREKVGGRMRFFVSGGAALPVHVAEFYMGTGLTVLQGYGLTETGGGTCINHPDRNKYWTVGESLGMDIKIAEDGEILIKGPGLMTGYYNLPDETAQALDKEGWFHTGDIGEFEGKSLKITDRKKDLLVLGNGKNIAPQPIENKLKASEYISEAVVLGDGMDHCIALVVPNFETVRKALNLPEGEPIGQNPEAKALIKKEFDRINKTLANFEMVKKHVILDKSFSVEDGELTPTLKVKRKVVKEKYAAQIASLR